MIILSVCPSVSAGLLRLLCQLPKLWKCRLCGLGMQSNRQVGKGRINGGPLHRIDNVVFDSFAGTPVVGPIQDRLDGV